MYVYYYHDEPRRMSRNKLFVKVSLCSDVFFLQFFLRRIAWNIKSEFVQVQVFNDIGWGQVLGNGPCFKDSLYFFRFKYLMVTVYRNRLPKHISSIRFIHSKNLKLFESQA